ncbi:MAG: hypothetical protein KJO33_07235 [Gammaproteobacteria bacterium]|nr:hypothetical protein [Gammaproteobacteria bacterium]
MRSTSVFALLLVFGLTAGPVFAQSAQDFHPGMSDRFNIGIGVFLPEKSLDVRVDGSDPGDEIDFAEQFNYDDSESTFSGMFRWKFGEKWSFWAQGWNVSDSGTAVLDQDIEWEDVIFKEGTNATSGMDLQVARLFFGRNFYTAPGHEFGIGAGLHWLDLELYLEGEIITNLGSTEFRRESVEADFPLPNIGAWYHFSWSPKWMFVSRVDWLSASIGDYSGGLWNIQAGVNWAAFRNVGLGLYYNFFELDVDIDKSDWRGAAKSTQHGPFLSLTATW